MTARDLPEAKIEVVAPGGAAATTAKPSQDDLQEAYDTLSEAILELYRLGFDGTANEATVALAILWAGATTPEIAASEASAAEGRKPNPEPVGVGEARPAEPPHPPNWPDSHDPTGPPSTDELLGGALRKERGDARADRDPFDDGALERLARSEMGYYRTHGHYVPPLAQRLLDARAANAALTEERDGLREQLDAARQALQAYHDLAPALAECANGCGEARLYSDLKQANDAARAALGVVGPPAQEETP